MCLIDVKTKKKTKSNNPTIKIITTQNEYIKRWNQNAVLILNPQAKGDFVLRMNYAL